MDNNASFESLSLRLDVLERDLAEFEQRHSDPENSSLLKRLRRHQAELGQRAAEARERGDAWDMIGYQLLRDLEGLEAQVASAIVGGEKSGTGPTTGADQ